MPDFRTVAANMENPTIADRLIDLTAAGQTIAGIFGKETPRMQAHAIEKKNAFIRDNLVTQEMISDAERRPFLQRVQEENAQRARDEEERAKTRFQQDITQFNQNQELVPLRKEQEQLQTQGMKYNLAQAMERAPSELINRSDKQSDATVFDLFMADDAAENPDNQLERADALKAMDSTHMKRLSQLMTVGDLAIKAERGKDDTAKRALPEALGRLNFELRDTPNGKVLFDRTTKTELPFDPDTFRQTFADFAKKAFTETNGRARVVRNANSASGRVANALVGEAVGAGYFKPEDYGHASTYFMNAITGSVNLDKNTPPAEMQRVTRELQGFDALSIFNEGMMSHDPDKRRELLQIGAQKVAPGKDGKYPLGGDLKIISSGGVEDPALADPHSLVWQFTPEGANSEPVIMPTDKMLEYLVERNPVFTRIAEAKNALEEGRKVAEKRMAEPKTPAEMMAYAKQIAEAEVPEDVYDRAEKVKKLTGEYYRSMKDGKPIAAPTQSMSDAEFGKLLGLPE